MERYSNAWTIQPYLHNHCRISTTIKATMLIQRRSPATPLPVVRMPGRFLAADGRTPDPDRLQRLPPRAAPTRYLFDDADVLMCPAGGLSVLRRGFP
jgi:hypothetical protein